MRLKNSAKTWTWIMMNINWWLNSLWVKCSSKIPTINAISQIWMKSEPVELVGPGSLNVPIEHHPTIRYMVYNGYYKVMSNIPKMGHLPTPVTSASALKAQLFLLPLSQSRFRLPRRENVCPAPVRSLGADTNAFTRPGGKLRYPAWLEKN